MARRILTFGYGVVAYLAFVGVFAYTVGFLGDFGVPKGVDDGVAGPVWAALLIDAGLLGLFAVQHSVMARPWFKRWWTRFVPVAIERSTYVLLASAVIAVLLWQWRPLADPVWSVSAQWARGLLWVLYFGGWALMLLSTILIGHFDLFGLRQVLARVRGRAYEEPSFREPLFYRVIRNPLLAGFLIAFWATPDMSFGHLLFAVASTGYILVGVRFEEHDLRRDLGEPYERYAERVPRFVPRPVSGRAH